MGPLPLLALMLLAKMPPDQLERARSLEVRAHQLQREGRYREAEEPLQEAIRLWRRHEGPRHIDALNDELSLAASYRRRGDAALAQVILEWHSGHKEKARELYLRSLKLSRKHLTEEHPQIQDALGGLDAIGPSDAGTR